MEDIRDDLHNLLSTCREFNALPTALTDGQAHSFFSEFSFERLFRTLASANGQGQVALVSGVLSKLLETDIGASLLPGALPYLEAASASPMMPLRHLAAEQYGKLLASTVRQHGLTAASLEADAEVTPAGSEELAATAALQLVRMLTSDSDTGVAAAAAKSLLSYGRSSMTALRRLLAPGSATAAALVAAAAGQDAAVRLRVLTLALELAVGGEPSGRGRSALSNGTGSSYAPLANGTSRGPEVADSRSGEEAGSSSSSAAASTAAVEYGHERLELLRSSGLLQPLLRQLSDMSDPLACLAAVQLLEDLMAADDVENGGGGGGGGGGVAAALAGIALPQLLNLVSEPMLADAALPLVAGIVRRSLPATLTAAAVAAAVAPVAEAAAANNASPSAGGATAAAVAAWQPLLHAAPALLAAVRAVLDERGDASPAAEASGLDAVGTLGQSTAGAALALADDDLLRGVCERALGRCPHPEVRQAGLHAVASLAGLERAGGERCRAAALLPPLCEEALRRNVFGASGVRRRPGEVLLGLLEQPFTEMRLAAYRCLAALSLRPWFAVEVATTPELLDRVTTPSSETGAAACGWRHAAAAALWATVSAAERGELTAAAAGGGPADAPYAATLAAPALVERVRAAVVAGPYGTEGGGGGAAAAAAAGRQMHEQHFVATRGGGGGV